MAADWRELDLTHFKMRVASWADLAFGCLPALKSALALLLAECDKPWELCLLPPVSTDSPGFSIKEAVHTAFVAMFIPQILLLGGIVGGGALAYMAVSSARYVKDWEERQHQECVKEFQENLQLIISRLEELEHEDR